MRESYQQNSKILFNKKWDYLCFLFSTLNELYWFFRIHLNLFNFLYVYEKTVKKINAITVQSPGKFWNMI